ncbi:amino acid adenylation domain-containing protein [Motilimonas cestriensis]|uniref:Amino acid adenylation domain-containing protein n=1 Tax=Motilimonas cestriensis TaxID=2742685 RepID=A0ABS8WBY2_9GAMM|nr:non-ribosomal peptide synthetase [Motilimonas cestriensis]MCE2595218.1 amino acid adenylation domain-containing protein [Motilimonas cestriensis]
MSMKALVERCLSEAISLSLNDDGGIDIHAESEISSATIELLKANKAELIAFLTSQQQKVVAKPLSAIAATGQPVGPLSFAQQRLWLIDQIDGESSQYNLATALQLKGMLNVDALERAIAKICARHQILRTVYRVHEDETVQQVVSDDWAFKLTQIDLTELDLATRKEEIATLIEQDAQRSFDLSTELMLRATLVKEQEQQFVLLLTMHHIASDGWSRHILCDEMFSLYNDFSAGRAPALPELPIQYSDYARWQRTELSGETLEKLTGYWREKLAGHSGQHSLPLDKARPKASSFKGQTIVRKLDVSTTAQWNRFAQQSGVTLFMLLHAGLVSLLSRYSNDTDIVIGTPTANRDNDQLAPLVGFFVNSLALRTELKQQCSFNELLQQCRDCLLDAFEHQQAPFEYLVEQMQVERHLNLSPIFQVMLALQNNAAGIPRLAGMEITPVEQQSQTAKFDLSLDVIETETGLELSWEYATDIFNHDTIASMAAHFEHLLQQCMAAPTQDIFTLAILTPPEQTAQLAQLLAPSMPDNLPCIHQLVEQQAVSEPHTKALVWQNRSLTYLELNQQANQLAHLLNKEHGVCQGHRVALMVERSIESIIGLLAILKLGAAYLPLDPATPAARLSHILQDSGVQLALTQQCFSQVIAQLKPDLARVELDLEATLQQCSEQPNANLPQTVSAQDVAYVIYTSGSTGLPKAVLQTHQTITNLVASTAKHDGLSTPLRTLQFTPLTFDVSIQELATTWYTASELVLITEAEKAQLDKLSERVEALQIQRLFVPPAVMQLVAEQALLQHKKLPELQQVIVAGEALYMSVELRQFFDGHPSCELWNHYGPTETHVATTFNATHSATDSWPAIGVAIEGIDSLILGPNQQLLPAGCVGELYIGGVGLAQGYLNQDELTAEKFIPHPYRQQDDARLYKTGDLVKRSPDGQLLYIGRRDNQVKLRGFRIELGEIEAKLSSCDGVVAAAVLLKQDPQLQKQLVAYVKLLNQQVKLEQIKVQLSANLPDYMQPSQYIALDALPLNRNGKIDRHALPEPDWQAKSRDYQAPSSATELALSQIWQDVLGHRQIGCSDNFFQLGGHSLSATRVIARVNHQFGINLAVKQLFEHQTLAQLAQAISLANVSDTEKFTPVSRDEPILASFAQQRLWLLDNIQGGSAQYNMHETLQLDGHLDLDALNRAFSYILARHESLRTCFQTDEQGAVYQLIQPASAMTIAVTDLSSQPMAQQGVNSQQIIEQEASRLFDLSQDMMLRAQLIRLSAQKHQLLVTMHHIAADGWSISILMNELSQAYRDYVAGTEVALAPLAFQYADYAHWQRRLLSGERLEQDLNYWQAKLQNLPLVHSLPLDYARPDQQSYRGAQLEQNLNLRASNAFKALCQNNDATLFMGLHGALASLISGYSNETDIVIGTPIANREQAEVAPMIGFFINNLVLRSDLTGKPTFKQLLGQSKITLLDAYDHQQTPFEQVIERLQPERSTSHAPLFQILLVLQNNETANIDLPGIRVNPIALNAQIAKYDLSINVKDTAQGLSFSWEYNTDIFKPSSIAAMAEHLTQLMDVICSSPDSPIANLNWISKSQLQQLVAWNDTQTHYPDNVCLQQVFEQKAVEFADQLAVADTTTQLTYAQLNAKANQLAHYLREQYQVAPEQLIGVSLARSVDTVVTLLAILKAGGAYLPLDPLYPPERLAFMLDDSQANLVITQQDIADKIVNLGRHVDTLVLEQANDAISSQKTSDLEMNDQHCRQLAYVIYTSGTTGKPKGTLLEHRGAVNLAFGQKSAFSVTAQSRVLQFASFSFDAATFEWLMALMHGASLHICSDDSRTNPALLQQMLVEQKITHATLPPSLLPHLDIEANYALQSLIVAGEACDPLQAQRWSQRYRLINAYGPSETTVCASAQVIEPGALLTIGRGIANTQLYVLGANLNLLPVGAVGELYIAGDGVGRGYLNRDDLTAQRFIEHTLIAGEPATRLYKTGDLVRWQSDGQLVFLGRADDQVKIRGYRIELAEVEQQILNTDGVKQCVALVREDKPGQPYLAAYLVASKTLVETEQKVLIETVRAQLAAQLPDYMIPSVIMCLEQLPLNSNGKIDRKALPQPDLNQGKIYVAPTTDTELCLAQIWQQVLDLEQVGTQDNFFQLGGHSLTATKVVTRVNHAFKINLPLRDFFRIESLAQLAEEVTRLETLASVQMDQDDNLLLDEVELTI